MNKLGIFRILLYIVMAIAAVIVGVQLYFSFYFDRQLKNRLIEEVSIQSNGEYELSVDNINTNIFIQSIYIKKFLLKPAKFSSSHAMYYISADELNMVDFNIFPFLFNKDLVVDRIELLNPSSVIYRADLRIDKEDIDTTARGSVYDILKNVVHSLLIKNLEVEDADIKIFDNSRDSLPSISSIKNRLELKNLNINEEIDESDRVFTAENAIVVLKEFKIVTKDSLYTFNAHRLVASYTDSTLTLDSVEMQPNYTKQQFSKEAGKQTDRFLIKTPRAAFHGMDVKLFFESNWFSGSALIIEDLFITAYRNKNYKREDVRVKSVQRLLRDVAFYTTLDTVRIENGYIRYEEVAEGFSKPGRVFFSNITAVITGLTNDTSVFTSQSKIVVDADAKFYDKARISSRLTFPLSTDQMVFSVSGRLTGLPMELVNPMVEPLAQISIKSGVLDSMVFSFHANDQIAQGKMRFAYHDLKVSVQDEENKKKVLASFAAGLLIKNENPSKNGEFRETEISYRRNPYRFIFNYTWNAMLSGIKPAIGLPEKKKEKD